MVSPDVGKKELYFYSTFKISTSTQMEFDLRLLHTDVNSRGSLLLQMAAPPPRPRGSQAWRRWRCGKYRAEGGRHGQDQQQYLRRNYYCDRNKGDARMQCALPISWQKFVKSPPCDDCPDMVVLIASLWEVVEGQIEGPCRLGSW